MDPGYRGLFEALKAVLGEDVARRLVTALPPTDEPPLARDDLRRELEPFVTKEDLRRALEPFVTKQDLQRALEPFVTKEDLQRALERFATKEDLERFATKEDFHGFELKFVQFTAGIDARIAQLETTLTRRMVAIMGAWTVMLASSFATALAILRMA